MKKQSIMKIVAVVLTMAMMATMVACGGNGDQSSTPSSGTQSSTPSDSSESSEPSTTPSTEEEPAEETYDFGGAVIRVAKGPFDDLNPDKEGDSSYITAWDVASQIEKKYNVKFEYVKLEGEDGWSDQQKILAGINNGEAFADIFCTEDNITINLKDYLADISADLDVLQMGSLFTDAGSWGGHTYGWTYDNLGNVDVLIYSRDYLKSIGYPTTPTEKFLKGEWSYDDALAYLTDLQSYLPSGTYTISVEPSHWAYLASAPNGVMPVEANGDIMLTSEQYISSLNYYRTLLDSGVAYPITDVSTDENGTIEDFSQPYALGDICDKNGANLFVLGVCEAWQMESFYNDHGDWGIVPFPWDPQFTTVGTTGEDDSYTTLSDTYKVSQRYWTNLVVPKAEYRAEGAAAIPDVILHKIAMDYIDLKDPTGAAARHAMYDAEQSGDATYQYMGKNPGTLGSFANQEDATLYDWLHTRVTLNYAHTLASYVRTTMTSYQGICVGDPRAAAESYASAGEQSLKDAGLK